jgi:FlaA1/EpsC-like NDP-sugar epimerase
MPLHPIHGVAKAYNGILAFVLTVVFWSYVAMMAVAFKNFGIRNLPSFILLNLAGIFGLIIAAMCGRSDATTLRSGGFLECHTLALKQTVYVGVTTLVFLFAVVQSATSRLLEVSLVFSFLLVLYIVFLTCHAFLRKRWGDQLFPREKHEEKILLIGPVEKARKIARWIEETAAFGTGSGVSEINAEDEESRILHVTRVPDVAVLERMIRNERIKQIILLEIPVDRQTQTLVVDVGNKAGIRLLVVDSFAHTFKHDIGLFNLNNHAAIILPL